MNDFGPIIDQARISNQRSARTGPITRVIWHHQASTNDDATIHMMVTGSRRVSSTYTVGNAPFGGRPDARITGVVPERFRPWTSSSPAGDGQALTVEVANSSGAPGWGISAASAEACARIAAYAYTAYGVPLRRATRTDRSGHLGHNEVIGMFGEGYATACPLHLPINAIIARATELVNGAVIEPENEEENDTMFLIHINDGDNRFGGGTFWALTGPGYWTTITTVEAANALAVRYADSGNVSYGEWDRAYAAAVSSGYVPRDGQTSDPNS